MRKKRRSSFKIFIKALFITALLLAFVGFIVVGAYETVTYGNFQTLTAWIDRFAGMGTEIEPAHLVYGTGDTAEKYCEYQISEYETAQQYEKLYVYRRMGLFDAPGGKMVDSLPPQAVQITQRYGDWLQINGYDQWIYLNFVPPIHVLEDFMQQFGNTVSVHYENMASGFVFRHNAYQQYFGASATKAPFALYIYLKTERGEASMDTVITYTSVDFWAGSGVIRHRYNVGQTFTQQQLLPFMLTPSDNIATRMLRRVHGLEGYEAFVEGIGANPDFVQNLTFSYLSANDAGIFLREMYLYIESGGRYSHEFRDNMLANRYAFIISDYPVASKSGWAANYGAAWHDMAIVYAPSPYILALLSSRAGNAADRVVYNSISMFVQEFNSKWFCP